MIALMDLTEWMDAQSEPGVLWYIKRLAGNDTLANGSHQAGPYIPKDVLFEIFPTLKQPLVKNPDIRFDMMVDSHPDVREIRAVWYNNKPHYKAIGDKRKGTRDEARLTNFGGETSALLDPESTGAVAIFAFWPTTDDAQSECHVWVCRHGTEDDIVEERFGSIDPGKWTLWAVDRPDLAHNANPQSSCWLSSEDMPSDWMTTFPTGAEIVRKAVELRPMMSMDVDSRLLTRRACEYEIFQSVEETIELPHILSGFKEMDNFLSRAQTILQRRKARSGRSLELHIREILLEENFQESTNFSHQPVSENGKRPDFLFPNSASYQDPNFNPNRLRMLAVKTSCKDRWRQIINEADRIPTKHLFTLQEGVSENQFAEMKEAGIQLVVPKSLHKRYPQSVQTHLQDLESFLGDIRLLTQP